MPPVLSSLHVYPLKGAGGFSPAEWEVDDRGFRYDRRWMLVDPAGDFITQREEPRLALVRTRIEPPHLVLEAPQMPPIRLALAPMGGREMTVRVWGQVVEAWLPDTKVDQWISEYLARPCGIAYMPEEASRPIDPAYAAPWREVSFADAFPFLVISEASLDDLNQRLPVSLPMNRFRPNLVIAGTAPFAEDRWQRIRIGQLHLDLAKPCDRCVVTTTDQDTAARSHEPLHTLATYRRWNGKVFFGQNAIHDATGQLAAGAVVEVLAEGDEGTGNGEPGTGRR
jgi:uncharacterized protein YcbX